MLFTGTPDTFTTATGIASFWVLDGRTRSRDAEVTVVKPPWGSATVVWKGGVNPTRLSLTVAVETSADFGSLEARLGETGTLAYLEGSLAAVLQSLSSGDYWSGGGQEVRTSWLLTG